MVTVNPIKNEHDYTAALQRIEALMDAEPDTREGDELDVLTTLVQAYEVKHYPVAPPEPVEAIKFAMEQRGLAPQDLEPYIGKTVMEILNRKRGLSLDMIRRLHRGLGIPLESLVGL